MKILLTLTFLFCTLLIIGQTNSTTPLIYEQDTLQPRPIFVPLKTKSASSYLESYGLNSPNNSLQLNINAAKNSLSYDLNKDDESILESSTINYSLTSGYIMNGLSIINSSTSTVNETLELPYGENSTYQNNYNELILSCTNAFNHHFTVTFRLYNEGLGFRITFTEPDNTNIYLENEVCQFKLTSTYNAYTESSNEQGYAKKTTSNNFSTLIPLTLTNDNNYVCINEAGNDIFARISLQSLGNNTLQTTLLGSNKNLPTPFTLPWRVVTIADELPELYNNKDIIYGLTYTDNYSPNKWEWVKPGKVFRCLTLTTQGAKEAIDFCTERNIPYMMFDAGWYGLGYGQGNEKNIASDPFDVIDAINMKEVTQYASSKKVGIILYINKVAWDNYDNEDMMDLYQSWGIKGVKLGFMDGYSTSGNQKIYNIIKMAAERGMVVNVHDNFRTTGLIFKYPNLLTAEGIRGNEYISNTGDHTTLLPFTRYLTGSGDYTIRYIGNDPNYKIPAYLKTTRAHQLAISIMFYSPLQHIFWGAIPSIYTIPVETEMFSQLPTVWEATKIIYSDLGKAVAIARKSKSKWYVAAISNSSAKTITIPLYFLDNSINYAITIYSDKDPNTIEKERTDVFTMQSTQQISNNRINIDLKANGGKVLIFDKDDSLSIDDPYIKLNMNLHPNPTQDGILVCDLGLLAIETSVSIYNAEGSLLMQQKNNSIETIKVDISNYPAGIYILKFNIDGTTIVRKVIKAL